MLLQWSQQYIDYIMTSNIHRYIAEMAVRISCKQDATSWYLSYNIVTTVFITTWQPTVDPKSEACINVFCPAGLADIYRTRPTHSRYLCIHGRVPVLGQWQKCKKRTKQMYYWYCFLAISCLNLNPREILFELSLSFIASIILIFHSKHINAVIIPNTEHRWCAVKYFVITYFVK